MSVLQNPVHTSGPKMASGYLSNPDGIIPTWSVNLSGYGFSSVSSIQVTAVGAGYAYVKELSGLTFSASVSSGYATGAFWLAIGT